jgi:TorA maturation chaperone TorD
VTVTTSDHAAELVSAAWLAARWWSRPLPDELEVWGRSWADARDAALGIGLEPDVVEALEVTLDASDLVALLDEYERLFVGPGRVPCQPYEALWRDDQPRRERGRLMGKASMDVLDLYRRLDLVLPAGAHELPDHVAIEWEALSYAFEIGSGDVASDLLEGHLAVWLPAFCAAVEAEAEEPFYRSLAALTPLWVTGLVAASAG